MPRESRAQYFRDRRTKIRTFSVEVDKEKMERFEEKLSQENMSKVKWLNERIDEYLGEEK